jgi:hypothetical protein
MTSVRMIEIQHPKSQGQLVKPLKEGQTPLKKQVKSFENKPNDPS